MADTPTAAESQGQREEVEGGSGRFGQECPEVSPQGGVFAPQRGSGKSNQGGGVIRALGAANTSLQEICDKLQWHVLFFLPSPCLCLTHHKYRVQQINR